jgi:hypothetical protein
VKVAARLGEYRRPAEQEIGEAVARRVSGELEDAIAEVALHSVDLDAPELAADAQRMGACRDGDGLGGLVVVLHRIARPDGRVAHTRIAMNERERRALGRLQRGVETEAELARRQSAEPFLHQEIVPEKAGPEIVDELRRYGPHMGKRGKVGLRIIAHGEARDVGAEDGDGHDIVRERPGVAQRERVLAAGHPVALHTPLVGRVLLHDHAGRERRRHVRFGVQSGIAPSDRVNAAFRQNATGERLARFQIVEAARQLAEIAAALLHIRDTGAARQSLAVLVTLVVAEIKETVFHHRLSEFTNSLPHTFALADQISQSTPMPVRQWRLLTPLEGQRR